MYIKLLTYCIIINEEDSVDNNMSHTMLYIGNSYVSTVKQEMLVAIIFGGFENITIWQDLIWSYYWKKVGGLHIFHFGDYMY